MPNRKFIILTEGYANPITAKTAVCVIRYCPEEVVALLDSTQAGKTSREVFGVGDVPFVSDLDEVPDAKTLLFGIANPGGKIPPAWRSLMLRAIDRGLDIVSGMHDFLAADPEFAAAAQSAGRAADRRPQEPAEARVPSRPIPAGLPPHPHRRPRLQRGQDGRVRRGDQRVETPRLRRQVRRHGPDRHHRRRRRLSDRLHGGRFHQRGRRTAGPGPPAPRDRPDRRTGQPGPPVLLGRHVGTAARLPAAGPDLLLRSRPDVAAGRPARPRCRPWPRSSN